MWVNEWYSPVLTLVKLFLIQLVFLLSTPASYRMFPLPRTWTWPNSTWVRILMKKFHATMSTTQFKWKDKPKFSCRLILRKIMLTVVRYFDRNQISFSSKHVYSTIWGLRSMKYYYWWTLLVNELKDILSLNCHSRNTLMLDCYQREWKHPPPTLLYSYF